jgi:hypothetical protein
MTKGGFAMKIIFLLLVTLFTNAIWGYGNYTDNGNGTVTDNITGLVWQKCSMGQNNDSICSGTATTATWVHAISYCEALSLGGHTDWRLPNVSALESLVDFSRFNPSINTSFFPGTVGNWYWSSSSYVGNTSTAWFVNFSNGYVDYNVKTNGVFVRCVRGL